MVIEPFVRMGPPPRSLAAEANDCFMVRTQYGYNRIQVCGAGTGAQWQVPLGSFCYLSPLCHRSASADFRAAVMDCAKENAAYEMPLTSKRPYKVLVPGAELLGVGGTSRRALTPDAGVPGAEWR